MSDLQDKVNRLKQLQVKKADAQARLDKYETAESDLVKEIKMQKAEMEAALAEVDGE